MNNKVNFLRGTSTEYETVTKDNDTFYYTTDDEKLYLGENKITGIEIDDTSTAATNKTWSAKKISDSIPTTLPANGGNADTVDGLHANEIASNPNLLINPNFAINQRGQTEYTASGYTVDRWQISNSARLTPHDGYITFESTVDKATPPLFQKFENPTALSGKTVTLSFDFDLKTEGAWISVQAVTNGSWNPSVPIYDTGRSIKSTVITLPENLTDLRLALVIHGTDSAPLATVDIYGAKLELGEIATPFTPPDPATELAKCQRYYQIHSTGDIAAVDLRPSMATIKDIKLREDGNYEYIAEL